ncbi:MAG: SDR family NAD(P)-dependent oxidoreductase [Ignavibacteria bacterium]|nr:SDR family NAD(P)-dependent oxidoreductase [Ignavibacteria bacterium]
MISRNVLITGANSGVGKALAVKIAAKKAKLIMLCRNEEKAEAARKEIIQKTGNEDVHIIIADLSSLNSVRTAAENIQKSFPEMYLIINNAGLSVQERKLSADGYEMTFAANYLGPFLLTNLLLDLLKNTAPSRIINIASEAHEKIEFDDLMSEKNYNGFKAYKHSKMANIMFSYELARRLEGTGVTVNCVHPGVVQTAIYKHIKGPGKILIDLMWPFFITPEKSADRIMPLTIPSKNKTVTGKYFVKGKEAESKEGSYSIADCKKLWYISEKLTGLNT